MTIRCLFAALASVALLAVPALAQEDADVAEKPAVTIEPALGAPGESIQVEGTGWPAGSFVNVAFCGNLALRGSGDCALDSGVGAAVGPEGRFGVTTVASAPPAPCPCVVHVTSLASPAKVDIPFDLEGHPVEPVVRPGNNRPAEYEVEVTSVDGWGPVPAWFGGAPQRDVTVLVRNTGAVVVDGASVIITTDRSPNPTQPAWEGTIELIPPGEAVEIVAPIELAAPAFGEYFISARVDDAPSSVTGRGSTTAWPWGLFVLAIVILQWPVLKLRNRVRRRLERSLVDEEPADGSVSDPFEEVGQGEEVEVPVGSAAATGAPGPPTGNGVSPTVPIALRRNGARGVPVIIETPITGPGTAESKVTIVVDASVEGEAPRVLGVSVSGNAKTHVEIVESTGGIETGLDDIVPARIDPDPDASWTVDGIAEQTTQVSLDGESGEEVAIKDFLSRTSDRHPNGNRA